MIGEVTRERGELEQEIMRLLRVQAQPIGARELQEMFSVQVPAYTTLMTVLTRLEKKGEVIRSGNSPRKVKFYPARSDEEHASQTMLSALGGAGDRRAALLAFAGNLDENDVALLSSSFATPRKKR
ncbi:BlaI/MecI/CopY family transcriptional regulator [Leucobacter sp. UCMA 4100]|uniref:BlaI/MecI/CopY family transcriptional regulator n=1 Tax=Leucobacter sp. UCMA 4100 TaxID=2810534 RepID=UPI0022EB9B32|nr:BlaI/MecI/CopY family transcriptional regulator [Leucobacter sp. UCMA 4100]MDA3147122.1 BlaI/MecI/CopY family transcriptional regulator [Leucobacter sp. UCMA 4100]